LRSRVTGVKSRGLKAEKVNYTSSGIIKGGQVAYVYREASHISLRLFGLKFVAGAFRSHPGVVRVVRPNYPSPYLT